VLARANGSLRFMFRALLRLLSMVMLAIAVIMAVLDATRSIAANALVLTPLGESWAAVSPSTLERVERSISESMPGFFSDPLATGFLSLPGFAVFAGLALLLAIAGRRPARAASRFVVQR
jgi:hypothetical protein